MEGSITPDTPKLPASVFYTESTLIEIKLKVKFSASLLADKQL